MRPNLDIDLRHSLRPQFNLLEIFGYWKTTDLFVDCKTIHKFYTIFMIAFTLLLFTLTETVSFFLSLDDVGKLSDVAFLSVTQLCEIVKVFYFFAYDQKVSYLLNSLDRATFKPKTAHQLEVLQRSMSNTRTIYAVYLSLCVTTCTLWALAPFLDDNMRLPLAGWYPFATDRSPAFEIVYCFQIGAVLVGGGMNITLDSIAAAFMAHVCSQYDILNEQIRHVHEQAMENLKGRNREEANVADGELENELAEELRRCVIHHYDLLEYTEEVSSLFSFSVFWQFLGSSIIICLTLYQLTTVSALSMKFLALLLYQSCILTEIVLYCWYGNEIIVKSSLLSESVYFSDWIGRSTKYKRNLLMIMTRTARPVRLYASNLFTLSLESFMTVLRTSWSYFAVLKSIDN